MIPIPKSLLPSAVFAFAIFPWSGQSTLTLPPSPIQPFSQWGRETLTQIDRDFWLSQRRLYAEDANLKKPQREAARQPAFMWSCGVELTALAAAARLDRVTYGSKVTSYADALDKYWVTNNGIGGYNVLPGSGGSDRYYDDNAWIVLAMLEIHGMTGNPRYLDKAEQTMRFVLSAEDQELGGGLYWQENKKESKNTCTNAPATVGLLELYQVTGKKEYLDAALLIYGWVCAHLQDADGLFWDNIKLTGEVSRPKLTYNTALMIRANCLLYQITGEQKYLDEARREGKAGVARWVKPDGGIGDGGRFAHLFTGSLLALARVDPDPTWRATVGRTLQYVHSKLRDRAGRYPNRWDKVPTAPLEKITLLDEASVARAYLEAATPFPPPKPLPSSKP